MKHQITRPATLEALADLRTFMDEVCAKAQLDDETTYDLKLAVDEAATNVIKHGYEGLEAGTIILSMQYGPAQMVLRLTDFGHPFEPAEPPSPDAEDTFATGDLGGYGLFFIYRSVDDVHYSATESGNHLTLIKRLTKETPS